MKTQKVHIEEEPISMGRRPRKNRGSEGKDLVGGWDGYG